ncbi:MAG TPA: DUF975 family protein [Candidatus Krumholzibacteria bacterium]|nr:DUF975 family protein [Candidatus Krumholzibacteria bacterium]
MPNPKGLPLSESIRFGWNTIKSSFAFILLTLCVAAIVPSIIDWGGKHVFHHDGQIFLIKVISTLVSATFSLGLFKIYLRFRDGEKPIFENLFDGLARAHIWFASTFIVTIAVVMGLILLIVPGIIMMLRLSLIGFVLVDERTGPIDAIQRSWDMTRGHTMDLLVLFIALLGLNILGLCCLFVGLFVTIPMSGLAMAYIYRELKPKTVVAPAMAPVGSTVAPAV